MKGHAKIILTVLLAILVLCSNLQAASIGELDHLLDQHQPKHLADRKALDQFEQKITLPGDPEPVTIAIPGFMHYACDKCHKGEDLAASAQTRIQQAIQTLKQADPSLKIPLRQYIIQPYQDKWLQGQQLAHTTFDTIRITPHGIIIDSKAYALATHQHEALHLTQPFLGHVNELEAYGLNARIDPRFLLLNYPYFADVVTAFFVPEFEQILKTYFARDTRNDLHVPREVQWFLTPFDKTSKLATAISKMSPLLDEVTRINREQYLEAAYQSERTGIPSLALDLAAVKLLPLTPTTSNPRALETLAQQMEKTDNTRLGYVIDRKKEALLYLQHQQAMTDPAERLQHYFQYLKQRYIRPDGQINLTPDDKTDFQQFVQTKIDGVRTMLKYEGITPIEMEAGRQWEEQIKKELSNH